MYTMFDDYFLFWIDHVCLSVYYLLLVKFELTQDKIIKYAEPIMHSTAILFGFGTAIASVAMNLFNGSEILWCWIDTLDLRHQLNFFFGPLWVFMMLVLGINIWIYRAVSRREHRAQKLHKIHHKNYGKPRAGEKHQKDRKTSVVLNRTKKQPSLDRNIWSMRSMVSTASNKMPNEPRVSFTFGQAPSYIFSISENDTSDFKRGEPSALGLHSIDEFSALGLQSSENTSEPLPTEKSEGAEQEKSLSGAEHADGIASLSLRSAENTSEPLPIANGTNSKQSTSLSEAEHPPRQSDSKKSTSDSSSRASIVPSRIRKIFSRDTMQEPSFMLPNGAKDDEKQVSQDEEESFFFNSLQSIQKIILPEKNARRFSRKIGKRQGSEQLKSMRSINTVDVNFVLATVEDYPSAARQYAATYHIGARLILYQSIAYVLFFWIIWVVPTIVQILHLKESFEPDDIFWLLFFQALFQPLQGFFNFVVYRFAHFLRLKELHPRWTMRKLFGHTMRWTFSTTRSDFEKREREGSAKGDSMKNTFINSMRVDETGKVHDLDLDLNSSSDESSGFIIWLG